MVRLLSFFTLLCTFALAAPYPLTLTDEMGQEVTLTAEPLRIVSMLPSHTETLCAIDACDKLIGIDDYSNFPEAVTALPQLGGGLFGANVEGIIALEPDLVLVSEYGDLADILREAGLTVYAGSPQTYEEALEFFSTLGTLVNRELQAARLAGRVEGQVETVAAITAGLAAPTVYYELDSTPYSVGPGGFIGFLITQAGGANIVTADMGDFPQLDPEFIVAADPDVIVLSYTLEDDPLASLAARPGWADIAAITTGRVIVLAGGQGDILNRPGPRIGEAVRLLASFFYPELF